MIKPHVLRILIASSVIISTLTACDRQATSGRQGVVIQMPTAEQLQKMSKADVSGFSALDFQKMCFAVNVKGPGIGANPPAEVKACHIARGIISKSVGVGGELALEVENGDDRSFELYAFLKDDVNNVCPEIPVEGRWAWALNKTYFLGKKEGVKVQLGMDPVEILFTMPDSSQNIAVQNSWPGTCVTAAASRIGRVTTGATVLGTAGGHRAYSKVTPINDQKTLGTTYKIRNWKVGE